MKYQILFSMLSMLLSFLPECLTVRTHLRIKHGKFKARVFKSVSLFDHLYDVKPVATFRFVEVNNQLAIANTPGEQGVDGPVYKKGWIKFIVLNPSMPRKFSNFYNNDAFDEQEKRHYDKGESDEYGKIDIPDRVHFFGVLTADSFYIVSARRNDLAKTTNVIPLKSLWNQMPSSNKFQGAVEEVGNFKEGFCFKMRQRNEGVIEWVICADTVEEKTTWMNAVVQAKLKQQGPSAYLLSSFNDPISTEVEIKGAFGMAGSDGANKKSYEEKGGGEVIDEKAKQDGYWQILQDWSTCTLACGGGSQTLQRLCTKPKNGGKPCEGDRVLTRACNTQPCPGEDSTTETEEAPLKVKLMRVTDRYQRYETCVIKEGDLNVVQEQFAQLKRKPRLPAHIVLNNRTFSVFAGSHYDSVAFSASLGDIMLVENYLDDPVSCFSVKNIKSKQKITLCAFSESKEGPESIKGKWIKAITFFRNYCFEGLKFAPDHEPDPIIEMKKQELEQEELDRNAGGDTEFDTRKAGDLAKSLTEMQTLAMQAIGKEAKYEQMQENEERLREGDEMKELEKKLESLRLKQDCLNRDIKKKSAKTEQDIRTRQLDFNFGDLKDSIKSMILKKRSEQSKRIDIMKKLAGKRKREMMEKINGLQMQMAQDMLKAEKSGNATLCNPAIQTKESVDGYCNKNFYDDPNMNKDCKDADTFCYMCCEMEVGVLYVSKREDCMGQCKSTKKSCNGTWVWIPQSNKVAPPPK